MNVEFDQLLAKRAKFFGCTEKEFSGLPSNAVEAFKSHKYAAKRRGIGFNFSLMEWWKIWESSGRWPERGPGGYVMARYGDIGPYRDGNVYICTAAQNFADYRESVKNKTITLEESNDINQRLCARAKTLSAQIGIPITLLASRCLAGYTVEDVIREKWEKIRLNSHRETECLIF